MQTWIEPVVSNAATATLMALLAALMTRFVRRPQVVYALWLLVLLKLITPPLVPVHLRVACFEKWMPTAVSPASGRLSVDTTRPIAESADKSQAEDLPASSSLATMGDAAFRRSDSGAGLPRSHAGLTRDSRPEWSIPWLAILASAWLMGAAAWFALVARRTVRFGQLLCRTEPASESLQAETRRLARRLGLREAPRLLVAESRIPPLVWWLGRRPTVLLPADLLTRLTAAQQAAVLAHELAHLRRRDHWMRWLDTPILGLFWWHPVAWWARRRLQHAEEQCCDAWVLWAFPGKAKEYAGALLAVIDFLSEIRPAMSPVACGFRQTSPLLRRFEMILREGTSHRMSWQTRVVLLAAAAVLLPLSPLALGSKGEEDKQLAPPATVVSSETTRPVMPGRSAPAARTPGRRLPATEGRSPIVAAHRQKAWEAKQRFLEAQAALEYHQRELARVETEALHESNRDVHPGQTQKTAAAPPASAASTAPHEPEYFAARKTLATTRHELLEAERQLALEKERCLEAEHRVVCLRRDVEIAIMTARLNAEAVNVAQNRPGKAEQDNQRLRERYEYWVAAKREVEAIAAAYEKEHVTLNVLLESQRRAAEAEIQYAIACYKGDGAVARSLEATVSARDRSLETWRQVQQRRAKGEASAADEARAREQYWLFVAQAEKATQKAAGAERKSRGGYEQHGKAGPPRR